MTIKLNGSTAGSVALDAPASTTGNADIQFKLPVADGTAGQVLQTDGSGNLSWVTPATTNGITMADSWMIDSNTNIGGGETDITSNWKRQVTGQSIIGVIGSAMTESSGIFTFPSACCPFSSIAAIVLPIARPLPFKVCTNLFFLSILVLIDDLLA